MRYSYATVSLPTLTPDEATRILRAHGYTGVEWKVGEAPHARTTNASGFLVGNRCTLKVSEQAGAEGGRLARENGLTVVGLTPYVQSGDLPMMRRVVAVAVAAGAPQIRLQAPRLQDGGPGYRSLYARFLDFLVDAVPVARAHGVRVVIELHHKTIVPSVGLAMPLLGYFDPDDLGVIYDVGNFVYEGYEDYRIGLELLGSYLHHVHLKNVDAFRDETGRWNYGWAPLDDGLVDVGHVLHLLAAAGYEGWVSMEDLSTQRDPVATLRHNANVLTRLHAPGWSPSPLAAADRCAS